MKKKLLTRFLCALLTVLTLVSVIPAAVLSVAAADEQLPMTDDGKIDYTKIVYSSPEAALESMTKYYENSDYALYCDAVLGTVAYVKKATGEIMFTNPWDIATAEDSTSTDVRAELMSQIILSYGKTSPVTLNSYTHAAQKGQIVVKNIKGGLRVEYAIGERSSRILVPQIIERTAFEDKILKPMMEALGEYSRDFIKFYAYFNDMFYTEISGAVKESVAAKYPVAKEKNIDIYVCDVNASTKELRWMEELILKYCPKYSFEEMDQDYEYVNYVEDAFSPPVFKMAIQYTIDKTGLVATVSGNGLRYDESTYRISNFELLPYMGTCNRNNEGYSFIPDGSGALYELDTRVTTTSRVYGDDYALFSNLATYHSEIVRMPVFGQVETLPNGQQRGYLAIIEQGESLASIQPKHGQGTDTEYSSAMASFVVKQSDVSASGWNVYAASRYVDDYSIRYIMLTDDVLAEQNELSSYYECSWMGMACAYRDYLSVTNKSFTRLTDEDVEDSIPLYIETFGCMDTVEKVLSMPVTVSVALTSFEDIATMYDYLAGNGVTNVNFKLKGYANGGLYSDVPYKLKWESAVGGSSGFKDLVEKAAEQGFGLYPDFDFVYTTQADGGSKVNMKKNISRTIDNRYTSKRVYSATYQSLISYYQLVMSPVTYSKFYEKLEKRYARYENMGISLGTLGSALNSDYDEEKISLREESKGYVIEALEYFVGKGYDIMVEGGNAYTLNYAHHILNVPLDSSRYTAEFSSVPFVGVVLHGYKEIAGSAMNMEGNLSYAMLKAMESGAAAYFILSYANTQLLKEDEILSQNYSVRYDIWQERLVEIYLELNSVLADVQTKLIVKHEILNHLADSNTVRVPDDDELLADIADAAQNAQQQIIDRLETEHKEQLAALNSANNQLKNAPASMNSEKNTVTSALNALKNLCGVNTNLTKNWIVPAEDATEQQIKALADAFGAVVNARYNAQQALKQAQQLVVSSKQNYDMLVAAGVTEQILVEAKANLVAVIENYEAVLNAYFSCDLTIDGEDALDYIDGADAAIENLVITYAVGQTEITVDSTDVLAYVLGQGTVTGNYAEIGVEGAYKAIVDALIATGYYTVGDSSSKIDVEALWNSKNAPATPTTPGSGEGSGENVENVAQSNKYVVDNNVVAVSYGESAKELYKTLLLNFNDYTIQTTYNGQTYTIEAYGYVVIKY